MGMWDIAARALVAAEAGARVTDLSGTPGFLKKREVLVANPKLHPRMLAVFPKVRV
jgi:fructose-1,6-bisphosphatase/inositol monophosphatase family enzyme